VLLEHGKEWCRLYRATFGGAVRQARSSGRPIGAAPRDRPADLRYRAWAAIVAGAPPASANVSHLVCIELWRQLDLAAFLERLVNRWKARAAAAALRGRLPPVAATRRSSRLLRSALLALVGGKPEPTDGLRPSPINRRR
jgi:hypothetical protein